MSPVPWTSIPGLSDLGARMVHNQINKGLLVSPLKSLEIGWNQTPLILRAKHEISSSSPTKTWKLKKPQRRYGGRPGERENAPDRRIQAHLRCKASWGVLSHVCGSVPWVLVLKFLSHCLQNVMGLQFQTQKIRTSCHHLAAGN